MGTAGARSRARDDATYMLGCESRFRDLHFVNMMELHSHTHTHRQTNARNGPCVMLMMMFCSTTYEYSGGI